MNIQYNMTLQLVIFQPTIQTIPNFFTVLWYIIIFNIGIKVIQNKIHFDYYNYQRHVYSRLTLIVYIKY